MNVQTMIRVLAGLILITVIGCTSIQTNSDHNPKTDFSLLKTYGWLNEIDQLSDDVRVNNKLTRETVRTAIEESLQAKGFKKADGDQADFLIAWFGAIEKKIRTENIEHFYAPYGYGTLYRDPNWNPELNQKPVAEYEEGSLIIDFLDPDKHGLIWRGTGTGKIVEEQTQERAQKNLSQAVHKILEGFPPR